MGHLQVRGVLMLCFLAVCCIIKATVNATCGRLEECVWKASYIIRVHYPKAEYASWRSRGNKNNGGFFFLLPLHHIGCQWKNVEVLPILASLGYLLQDQQLNSPTIHPSAHPGLKLATTAWCMGLSSHFHCCLWHESGPPLKHNHEFSWIMMSS